MNRYQPIVIWTAVLTWGFHESALFSAEPGQTAAREIESGLVRYVWTVNSPDSCHWEQAFAGLGRVLGNKLDHELCSGQAMILAKPAEDYGLPILAGVIPLELRTVKPIPDSANNSKIPEDVRRYRRAKMRRSKASRM